jgi:hydrogenase large subunit
MASVRSIDDALNITLNAGGRIIRNLIHGADTIMSHILHFYHLSAADFVDVSALGSPWDDGSGNSAFGTLATTDALTPLTTISALVSVTTYGGRITGELVESYVNALNMRKKAHSMGAIFSGRHPIQNAIVPGGVSTIYNASDIVNFRSNLNTIRNFINSYYIPDVVFVATRSGASGMDWTKYWTVGTNPGTLLSYGEYPLSNQGQPFSDVQNTGLLIHRGVASYNGISGTPSFTTFNSSKIKEYVTNSFYDDSTNELHPSVGVTSPLTDAALSTAMAGTTKYSWLKSPRYNGSAAEVGPLARMIVTVVSGTTQPTVTESGSNKLSTYIPGLPDISAGYNASTLVTEALGRAAVVAGTPLGIGRLFSPLGRHAARALECKYVADAMYGWLDELAALPTSTSDGLGYTTATPVASGYSYVKIPKAASGEGLAEAPRGALGHWITISSKKIANYQCVVPSTWNACPGNATIGAGPAESVLNNLAVGTNDNNAVLNIARMLHPYDFCIACAVHVVTPEGKEITKFDMGLDGTVKKL